MAAPGSARGNGSQTGCSTRCVWWITDAGQGLLRHSLRHPTDGTVLNCPVTSSPEGAYESAVQSDPNPHYVNASQLWPKMMHDSPTVGGCHHADEGGERVAEFYTKMIPQWIRK